MSKQDSVNRYLDQYLAGKTPEQRSRFLARPVERQYQSIMTWRYNQRRRAAAQAAPAAPQADDPSALISRIRTLVDAGALETEAAVAALIADIDALRRHMDEHLQQRRRQEIRRLEQQQEEIAARLRTLRADVPSAPADASAPSLFD